VRAHDTQLDVMRAVKVLLPDMARESVRRWVEHIDADPDPTIVSVPDRDRGDASTVDVISFEGGRNGSRVALVRVNGGGHVEPSRVERYPLLWELVVGRQNHDLEMAPLARDFFAAGW